MPQPVLVPTALTIAGSDSSGGAGIQADLKTFAALGVYGASVLTALTAQNTTGVRAIHDPPVEFVAAQLDSVFEDLRIDAVKLGMLSRAAVIECVGERLVRFAAKNVVLDPVMVSKSGARLLAPEAVAALKSVLFPLAAVITPNLPEAAVLLGVPEIEVHTQPEWACRELVKLGARTVVLKGGHAGGRFSEDLFHDGSQWMRLPAQRIATDNTHGTGCTFSSAITAHLARGAKLERAVALAKDWLTEAIHGARDWKLGHGQGPVHHFHALWPNEAAKS
ncbi:MAG: bifunctional hydroxymethylpyrimidine kinase/phosphomethylpyrimidine kinase [Planctomycetes bacterium]|nr:bifunctional hydroxymethylpyrimidine kinase/phosphomethylpyrimidine kinase [Planctomycetota bacterium]